MPTLSVSDVPPFQKFFRLTASKEKIVGECLSHYLETESFKLSETEAAEKMVNPQSLGNCKSEIAKRASDLIKDTDIAVQNAKAASKTLLDLVHTDAKNGNLTWTTGLPKTDFDDTPFQLEEVWSVDNGGPLGPYVFLSLPSAAVAVKPALLQMRSLAAVGDDKGLSQAYAKGLDNLRECYPNFNDCRRVFGMLELLRHYICLRITSLNGFLSITEFSTANSALVDACRSVKILDTDINELREKRFSPNELLSFKSVFLSAIMEYSTFFHVLISFHELLAGRLEALADALSPYNSNYLGFSRFPAVKEACTLCDLHGLNPLNGLQFKYAKTVAMTKSNHVFPSATGGPMTSIPALISNILIPCPQYAAVHFMATIASKPLSEGLFLVKSLPELRQVYGTSEKLPVLLEAAERGDYKQMTALGSEIGETLLSEEPFFSPSFLVTLRNRYVYAICFNACVVHQCLETKQLSVWLGITEENVLAVLKAHICEGTLHARLDLVDMKLHLLAPPSPSSVLQCIETLFSTVRSAESQIRALEVERNFYYPSLKAAEKEF